MDKVLHMLTFVSCLKKLKFKEKKMLDGIGNFLNVKRRYYKVIS
jgi:hypothetical protein